MEETAGTQSQFFQCSSAVPSCTKVKAMSRGCIIHCDVCSSPGNKVHRNNIDDSIRKSRQKPPAPFGIDFKRPVHCPEATGDAGPRISNYNARPKDDRRNLCALRAYQLFGRAFGFFVNVPVLSLIVH